MIIRLYQGEGLVHCNYTFVQGDGLVQCNDMFVSGTGFSAV